MKIKVRISNEEDTKYASLICKKIKESAKSRGTGISKKDPEYIKSKMINGNAVVAFYNGKIAGFSYLEVFQSKEFVVNSGLIVFPEFRKRGLAKIIKIEIFKLSKKKFPNSKIFSITTSNSVIKMNTELGFKPVSFSELTQSEEFWMGCRSCDNFDILTRNKRKMCLCTGLLYNPKEKKKKSLTYGDKIVLAYSGGLDTSYCLKYLIQQKGYEVHTVIVHTGGFKDKELKKIEELALNIGAKSHKTIDALEEYYQNCIKYLIFGNILKNNTYPLSVSSERIFQAIKIAQYANRIKAIAIAHGSTGAGNDQIRFDVAFQIICPEKITLSPIRDLKISRKEEIEYLQNSGISIVWDQYQYSINKGIWGTSIGGKETLNSSQKVPDEAYTKKLIRKESENLELEFEKGELVSVNKKKGKAIKNIIKIERIASKFSIGRGIHIGDTILGIKGRVAFEASAAIIIIQAHHFLEKHILTKWQLYWKEQLSNWYGMLLHEAQYLDPVMRDIERFLISTQERITGTVYMILYPYRFRLVGIKSKFDLMETNIHMAQYGEMNYAWTSEDVKGFTKILSNQMKMYHNLNKKK
ncbi:MAG: argininosuccinate synthase [Flavobacteriales bacterium]|jgi:argininosuccinate synthase|uniref:argininosuccinate synthase domain-containing protein n=1 Tax=Blattabacterium sp. (Mastotermes darwiniensis) TaxID=39768 RepID=UPI000231DE2F|nr:argininosuccinate synthase domain-containing protein [Blattabacterium sp. (Mastotermes darwiniensis)]AER40611.1 argininosuccinate synthase(argG)/acetyltransferase activity of N-acetylglutamate synthase (argA) [Blattabacterium sp. (Mastotermes darwiniensis) str. MADAR]MDR1805108.1 argininosuccinate synthase [Flavobacteriales bacterium]